MMQKGNGEGSAVQFDGWEIRPAERLLIIRGTSTAVGGRAFDVLHALVQRHGRLVTKDELLEAAWPGLVVEENNVSVQIAALRKLLGSQVIATVAGRGYQLSAPPLQAGGANRDAAAAINEPAESAAELLGRQQDLQAVLDRLAESALVTLVGPGGVGKTALAREAFARRCALQQQPGVWVDLAPVREPQRVVPLLAQALGVDVQAGAVQVDALITALDQSRGLVVLDNCEHVQPALASFVHRALASGCGLRWLATSQHPLRVAGEAVYRLEPLAVPADSRLQPAQAMEFGAVALLCKRAADADRRFRLSEANVGAVIGLCDRLDGLPLAIEMAAARVASIGLDEVHGLLGQRLKLSIGHGRDLGHRHATLRDTYDWSYGLLADAEQAVFRRLEPFLGGFVTDLAQQVARDDDEGGAIGPWEVLDALAALVDKSLVQRGTDGAGRFYLLESARDHARASLQACSEYQAVHRRHARAVAQRLSGAQADALVMNDAAWTQRYVAECHNARAAVAHCSAHGQADGAADDLARLVTALAMMDWMLCRQAEILQTDIPLSLLAQAAPRLRAEAYLELSWAHFSDGDHRLGAQLARDAHALFVALDAPAQAYRALAQLTRLLETLPGMAEAAQAAWQQMLATQNSPMPRRTRLFCAISGGLVTRPEMTAERLEALGREAEHEGFDAIAAIAACNHTDKLLVAARDADVVAAADRALGRYHAAHRACACMLLNKTTALIRLGRQSEATESARQAFRLMPAVAPALVDAFALAAARDQRLADAAVLHGCGTQIRERLSHAPDPAEAASIAETAARLHAGLPASQRRELMALGAAMAANEALSIKVFSRAAPARAGPPAAAADPASSADASLAS